MAEHPDKAVRNHEEPGKQGTMTKTAYAEYRGVSRRAVHKAIANGRIVGAEMPNGKIDVAVADRLWRENSDPFRGGRREKVTISEADALAVFAECSAKGEVPPIAVSRLMLLHCKAQMLKLKYELKTGVLIEAAVVEREWFRLGRWARDAAFAIADRMAAEIAGDSDPVRVHRRLVEEFTIALGPIIDHAKG